MPYFAFMPTNAVLVRKIDKAQEIIKKGSLREGAGAAGD